jgi:hypothetical protein
MKHGARMNETFVERETIFMSILSIILISKDVRMLLGYRKRAFRALFYFLQPQSVELVKRCS